MLDLVDLTLAVAGNILLDRVTWRINPGQRVGLVGRNGAGKSTLLKAICGKFPIDSGELKIRPDLVVGYLPQHAVSDSVRPLWEEVASGMTRIQTAKAAVERAEAAMAAGEEKALERLEKALEVWRLAGGPSADERVGEVLHGLGFTKEDWTKTCDTFSGGWQMRIALARLLLAEPTILLLDEPTNHLDMAARAWLGKFLARYPHTVLIVSHDRHLLDQAVSHIAELVDGRLDVYSGNFTYWMKNREERRNQQQAAFESQQEEIERLQRYIDRFRYAANRATQAQSRIKALDRMDKIDAPEEEFIPTLRLPEPEVGILEPLALRKAAFGWGEQPMYENLDFSLEKGMRVALLGPNGAGKSTLLKALAGTLPLKSGRRLVGKGIRIGIYSQDLSRELPPDEVALDHVVASWPLAQPQRARAVLGSLGLPGELALRKIGSLSGGEKARVALACIALRPHEVLLLDEPTNHLDVVTVEVLVEALAAYTGALLVVTHDRFLVERVATHVAHVLPGKVELHEGVRPEDFEPVSLQRAMEGGSAPESAEDFNNRKKQAREREKARRRVEQLGQLIEATEGKLGEVDGELCTPGLDHRKVTALSQQRAALEQQIAAYYEEWERLEATISG